MIAPLQMVLDFGQEPQNTGSIDDLAHCIQILHRIKALRLHAKQPGKRESRKEPIQCMCKTTHMQMVMLHHIVHA